MRVRKWKAAGIVLFTLSLIFLFVGTIMPYYKSPQRLEGTGPGIEFTASRPYWINSYFIPPIDAGQPISLTVLSDREGTTTVVLAYYDQARQSIVAPALVTVIFSPDEKGLAVFTKADRSGPYLLTITSYNSSYTFYLTSVWSPFYILRTLTIYAFGLLPLGLVTIYYDQIVEERERIAEEALLGIKNPR
ncbi:MAG: hypothetical protein ABSF00_08265 [Candidatus Bathyarchaeia archaeon]